MDKLVKWAENIKISDPLEEGCRLGPIVSEAQVCFSVYQFCIHEMLLSLPHDVKITHQLFVERLKEAIESYLSFLYDSV